MKDKRKSARVRRQIRVTVSDGGPARSALTTNLSKTGFSMSSVYVFPTGTQLRGELSVPKAAAIPFEAEVRWVRKPRASRALHEPHTLGLQFTSPPGAAYLAYLGLPDADRDTGAREIDLEPAAAEPPPAAPAAAPAAAAIARVIPQKPASEDIDWKSLPVSALLKPGVEGTHTADVIETDLATLGQSSITPLIASAWIERAAMAALRPMLPEGVVTIAQSLQVEVTHSPPTPLGARLTTTARLIEIGPGGRRVFFSATIRDGAREVAVGKHVRQVFDQRNPVIKSRR